MFATLEQYSKGLKEKEEKEKENLENGIVFLKEETKKLS